jgi:Tol biopolymer transport system component
MATVHHAEDIRHERQVALKVLHPDLGAALGAERFLTEIKTTAKLQHPHILPLLDSGEADGLLFYVMPLVDGETLRTRLERERQLPLDDAIRITTETAGALDYAHRHGVIHRDIKPENILLHDGRAVVADFGIALAVSAASGSRMTQTGLSLGTPQYMSPEQAMGERTIDARADVYALGAVLYELLTGEPPFTGATVQAIVAKVLTERPMNPTAVRDTIPRHVEVSVLKALAKLPADRFATPAQFAEALKHPEIMSGATGATMATPGTGMRPAPRGVRRFVAATPVIWAALAATAALAAYGWTPQARPASPPLISVPLTDAGGVSTQTPTGGVAVMLSPDGTKLAFLGSDSTRMSRLFVRSLSDGSVTAVPKSEFGRFPAFSPDGQAIAFIRDGQLVVWTIGSGSVRTMGQATQARGLAWMPDSTLIYSAGGKLAQLRLRDGTSSTLVAPSDSSSFVLPSVASANVVLFTILAPDGTGEAAAYFRREQRLTRLGLRGWRFLYVDGGLITFNDENNSINAAEVDPSTFTPRGTTHSVAEVATLSGPTIGYSYAVSRNGVLVYQRADRAVEQALELVDRSGKSRPALAARHVYRMPRFSPDGRRIAVGISGSLGMTTGDVWVVNPETGTIDRVTSDGLSSEPEWDPDGRAVIYLQRDKPLTPGHLSRITVDGAGKPVDLLRRTRSIWESRLTPDRRTLVWREDVATNNRDIFYAPLDSPTVAHPLRTGDFDDRGFAMSPDGKWIAYTSNEKGAPEIFLCRIESNGPRWLVSRAGGAEPRWARTGELFFRNADTVLTVRVDLGGAEPRIGTPSPLFTGAYASAPYEPLWDVSPDARQFVMVRLPAGAGSRLQLMVNWGDRWRTGRR